MTMSGSGPLKPPNDGDENWNSETPRRNWSIFLPIAKAAFRGASHFRCTRLLQPKMCYIWHVLKGTLLKFCRRSVVRTLQCAVFFDRMCR